MSAVPYQNLKKKCTGQCGQWLPATTEYFYHNKSHNRRYTADGRPYLRGKCKKCMRKEDKTYSKKKKTEEAKERDKIVKRARNEALRELSTKYQEDFLTIYARKLNEKGIKLHHHYAPIALTRRAEKNLKSKLHNKQGLTDE